MERAERPDSCQSDHTRASNGWIGFSDPVPTDLKTEASIAATTLGLVVIFALILLIPSVAAGVLAALVGIEDYLDLTAVAFLALGLTGYGAFWAYFCSHVLGVVFSCGGLLASCAVIGYGSITPNRRARLQPLKRLIAPAALVVLASIFILSLGFLHGGKEAPLTLAGDRFGPPGLISDNLIPKWFADGVFAGHIPRPLFGDWQSSDRPPLQTGNTLWTYAWISGDRNLAYLVLSVILQCSFLAALWSFLTACKIDRRALALALATCIFSGFTLLNELFTWPKLYPVGFLLIMAAYLLTSRYSLVRDRMAIGATTGAAAAFAMLCHGGSIFALVGMAIFMLVTRRYPSRRFLLGIAIIGLLLYSPWMLYQKLYEPPGNRLLLWHLAGIIEPHPEGGVTRLVVSQYGKLQPGQLMQYKASNFKVLGGNLAQGLEEIGVFGATLAAGPADTRDDVAGSIRRNMLFHWIPAIGFSVLGPLALLLLGLSRRRSHEVEFITAARMWGLTGLTLAIWCLVMFGWEDAIPHHGVYLTEILAFTGSCLAFWAIRPWLAVALTTLQVLWNAALFIWLTPIAIRGVGSTLAGPVNPVLGAVCLLSAAAIFALLAGFARQPAATAAGATPDSRLVTGFRPAQRDIL